MHSTADWINPAATRDSVIAICRNVLTFRAEFLANTHTRAYLVRHVQWLESERKVRIEPTANVKLILQPDDGLSPLIKTIDGATRSIEIAIFRFDRAGYPERSRTRPHRKYESRGRRDPTC
jgi:hypothetical protein